MIKWTHERLTSLKQEIERAKKQRKSVAEHYGWTDNLERYVPLPIRGADGRATYDVNVGADFQDVHRKLAALFYDSPTVSLTPAEPSMPLGQAAPPDPMTGQPSGPPPMTMGTLTHLHQRLLNGYLKQAKAKGKVLKVLFDVLCPAGVGAVKVGYDAVAVPVEQPVLDQVTGQPVLNALGLPETQVVPVPIHEEWYWARISPFSYLVPTKHRDTDVAEAPWVGYDFCLPASAARRRFGLPEDWKPKGAGGLGEDKPYYQDDDLKASADDSEPEIAGVYLEYHPAQFSEPGDALFHPKQIFEMVLVEGEEQPILHRPSPYQTIDPKTAQMTPDSIQRFTIVPLTLRDRTDQAYVPSDCTVTAPLTKELNTYRTIIVKQRDSNRLIMQYDPTLIDPDQRDKIKNGDVGTWVPTTPGALSGGQEPIKQVVQLAQGREAWQGQDYIQADRERILGIGANQVGVQAKTNRTATEANNVQRNTEARFEQERQRVLEWYLEAVCLFDAMILRLMDVNMAARVLGPVAAQAWAANKQHLAGAYAYATQIDSGKYVDVEAEKQQWMQLLNMVGQSQHVNVVPILKRLVSAFGLDPSEAVVDQPPQKGPEPPKVNVTLKGDDFNPGLPQFELIIEIARKGGYEFSMEAVAAAKEKAALQALTAIATPAQSDTPVGQPPPGEPPQVTETLPKMPTLNQHQSEESGALPGPGPT